MSDTISPIRHGLWIGASFVLGLLTDAECSKRMEPAPSPPQACYCDDVQANYVAGQVLQLSERVRVLEARVNRQADVP